VLERRGLKYREWAVEWEASAQDFLLEKGFSAEMGARPLKRAIQRLVQDPLAMMLLEGKFSEGDTVTVDAKGSELTFTRAASAAPAAAAVS